MNFLYQNYLAFRYIFHIILLGKAQERQKRDYDRRHKLPSSFKVNSKVCLKNQKRIDRKGGKFSYKWTGPYEIQSASKKGKIYIHISVAGLLLLWKNIFGTRHKFFSVQIHFHPLRHITLRGLNFAGIKFRGSLHPRNFDTFAGI